MLKFNYTQEAPFCGGELRTVLGEAFPDEAYPPGFEVDTPGIEYIVAWCAKVKIPDGPSWGPKVAYPMLQACATGPGGNEPGATLNDEKWKLFCWIHFDMTKETLTWDKAFNELKFFRDEDLEAAAENVKM